MIMAKREDTLISDFPEGLIAGGERRSTKRRKRRGKNHHLYHLKRLLTDGVIMVISIGRIDNPANGKAIFVELMTKNDKWQGSC